MGGVAGRKRLEIECRIVRSVLVGKDRNVSDARVRLGIEPVTSGEGSEQLCRQHPTLLGFAGSQQTVVTKRRRNSTSSRVAVFLSRVRSVTPRSPMETKRRLEMATRCV